MKKNRQIFTTYRGRFAPSPTGLLHFGSLVAAVGSYLDAKSRAGEWSIRIEDLDSSREIPGASHEILNMLEKLGMEWDGEVIYQSRREIIYQKALARLDKLGLVYPCSCSRKEIADSGINGINGPIYPGICRNHRAKAKHKKPSALRIQTDNKPIQFIDILQGAFCQQLKKDVGDFVLQRSDGIYAYQLAVVVDDAQQNITHVVRGADLINSTPRQIYLQQLLGFSTPEYMHLPVVTNSLGEKLSKQTNAAPISLSNALSQLISAVHFLGQEPPRELIDGNISSFWQWAIAHWQSDKIQFK